MVFMKTIHAAKVPFSPSSPIGSDKRLFGPPPAQSVRVLSGAALTVNDGFDAVGARRLIGQDWPHTGDEVAYQWAVGRAASLRRRRVRDPQLTSNDIRPDPKDAPVQKVVMWISSAAESLARHLIILDANFSLSLGLREPRHLCDQFRDFFVDVSPAVALLPKGIARTTCTKHSESPEQL